MKNVSNNILGISFILPLINETNSLKSTIESIFNLAEGYICEILIVIAEKTTEESLAIARQYEQDYPAVVRIYKQRRPYIGNALSEAFAISRGEYIMLMSSDLETDPVYITEFIRVMESGNYDIVAASRWLCGGGFEGYGRIKLLCNFLFQMGLRIYYQSNLTDMTFGYRLYRRGIIEKIHWREDKHPFFLESLLRPLKDKARIAEIPCKWKARGEGSTENNLWKMFRYIPIAIKVRLGG